jgi:hypothetical protein
VGEVGEVVALEGGTVVVGASVLLGAVEVDTTDVGSVVEDAVPGVAVSVVGAVTVVESAAVSTRVGPWPPPLAAIAAEAATPTTRTADAARMPARRRARCRTRSSATRSRTMSVSSASER